MTIPSADQLCEGLLGRPVRTYLGREARIERIEDGVAGLADDRGIERARVPLADVQAGLDRLDAAGEAPVTIGALGPSATYVAAVLVEVEGAAYDGRRRGSCSLPLDGAAQIDRAPCTRWSRH